MGEITSNYATILQVKKLDKNFGGLKAVQEFDLDLRQGEIKGLIGPNGAGKSTVFNMISGLHKPNAGTVLFQNEDITGRSPDQIAKRGIARTFQIVKLLQGISVIETMKTAFFLSAGHTVFDALFQTRRYQRREKWMEEQALAYLALLGVDHLKNHKTNELSYGLQRKVSIARTLTLSPSVLLLDEPTCGLNHAEKDELIESILHIKDKFELSIILVEHDMQVIMNICDSILVMNQGTAIAEGTSNEIRNNPHVIEAYLGTGTV